MKELLENDYIRLRALEPEDLDWLYRWENDTTLWLRSDTLSPYSRYIIKQYIGEAHRGIYDQKQLRLIIEEKETGKKAGMIDLYDFDPHHRKAGIGIMLDPVWQGKGVATEALELIMKYATTFLKLHQLYAYIAVNNTPSQSLFERCGFSLSGTLKDWISTPDGYADVLIYQKITSEK